MAQKPKWLTKTTAIIKEKLEPGILDGGPAKPFVLPPVDSGLFTTYGFENYLKLKASPQLQADNLKGTAKLLYQQVEHWTELSPIHVEGREWAGIKVDQLADAIGVSTKQIQRLSRRPPFHTVTKLIDKRTRKLIRIGHPSDMTHEDFARIMVHDWRKATKREEQNGDFGLLVGMVKDSPRGLAPDVFRSVVANWTAFMAGVHFAIGMAEVDGDFFEEDPKKFEKKYFHYPAITVIRRFWPVALELYHMFIQENQAEGPILYSKLNKILMKHEILSSS